MLKGSARQGESALSFLSVFFHELSLTVAQTPQNGRHEAHVLDDMLETIKSVFGERWMITLDAAYTEKGLTGRIVEAGGAYFVPLKNNTRIFKEWAKLTFQHPPAMTYQDEERRSGETWIRMTSTQTEIPDDILLALPAAQTLIRREYHVTHRDGRVTQEVRYAVSSVLLTAREAEDIWRVEGWNHDRHGFGRTTVPSRRSTLHTVSVIPMAIAGVRCAY
ncbi:hypothetical protein DESA109040_01730 [Deinococcus saxicola]